MIKKDWIFASTSALLLLLAIVFDHWLRPSWFDGAIRMSWYLCAYLPVGIPVLMTAIKLALKKELFTEFSLMSLATFGAFYLRDYAEGVTVMLFYSVGELLQSLAVTRAKRNIQKLLDVRPDKARVLRGSEFVQLSPAEIQIGDVIQVRAGERVPLDGVMIKGGATFNTAALTGESLPRFIDVNEPVLAGMINESDVTEIKVSKLFNDSSLARILALVQGAQGRKAATELFIRRFAKVYTPIVVSLATAVVLVPYFFVDVYNFDEWLYRALIFLVVSCPCALVVAIPLGYIGGIGAASKNGILFKGSSYLDKLMSVRTVVMDKTGTLTRGVFQIRETVSINGEAQRWFSKLAALESRSTHPISKAFKQTPDHVVENVKEHKGFGITGLVDGNYLIAGNAKLMARNGVSVPNRLTTGETIVYAAIDGVLVGYVTFEDELKTDAKAAIKEMHRIGLTTVMLSGDRQETATSVATALGISNVHGNLLPEDKVSRFEDIQRSTPFPVAFVGDGINDAPVLAISDVGIAMGGLGSDAAIETADVVIQNDEPSKINTAIRIAFATNKIVWQNISLAFLVKVVVMLLGVLGTATMWEAVFADVGVALLAIVNAIRIQRMRFD